MDTSKKGVVFPPVTSQLAHSPVNSMMNWGPLARGATVVRRRFGSEVPDTDAESEGGEGDEDGEEEGNRVMVDVEVDEDDI